MILNIIWFILIATLFTGFFVLEGFDYGVGILTPFLGRTDEQRRLIINTIGPFWDANEVWLITAGGAMFAAFPNWYATLFSGFYIAFFLLLVALIVRAVAFEFRSKISNPRWRTTWDWLLFGGSVLPPFLWGVAVANFMSGVPIDSNMNYVGTFWNLITPFSIMGGLSLLLLSTLHGALYLSLRTFGEMQERARETARRIGVLASLVMFLFAVLSFYNTDLFSKIGINPGAVPVLAAMTLLSVPFFIHAKRDGWAFLMTTMTIVFSSITVFLQMFPRVMISSLNPEWSLTIYNAASGPYSLRVMTIITVCVLPFVLAYQAWTYWVFRHRLRPGGHMDY
ncbi:cytochrome d ubiquinol oxidase subunit II [Effusibacillus lacus]|uniref:Cytochrome d ubiquinol oxidase subunit 2 n=1 Tax=Effusibacillus lacus TaxID=1348429 RepID=A0A292YK79_9BACL|nr:cytochrome d ubiquinol oxidase subunit II [Effusibacillus lacus]TCS72048.1 cytochrome bd-I ubiquinol oxidase subunit 2 apoprotein [Effusibacillus lacus]GAX90338.1 cytochrome d ubiquinol oxidase subunit 2 [Effusibacillus lacus]